MDLEIGAYELAICVAHTLIVGLPLYMYNMISREYRMRAQAMKAKIPLLTAQEIERHAREDFNRRHHFLRLPGELRNRIYSLCMVSEAVIDTVWGSLRGLKQMNDTEFRLVTLDRTIFPSYISGLYPAHKYEPSDFARARMANMTQVCRAWRTEALKHFYGSNVLKLPIGKHLHERKQPQTRGYMAWPLWISHFWQHHTVAGPAGRFAVRHHYTHGLRKRPQEAFGVLTLVLHDYRHCPHFVPQHSLQTLHGSCMIVVDFHRRTIHAAGESYSHKDYFNLWDCDHCWKQFVANVTRLNRNEEMVRFFAEFHDNMCAGRAIGVVDGIRRILEDEYER